MATHMTEQFKSCILNSWTQLNTENPVTEWVSPTGLTLTNVHDEAGCVGACVIHRPTLHHMSDWYLVWRGDRGIFERICPHGTGHPDPDQLDYWKRTGQEWQSVHGCDGCCQDWSFTNNGELHEVR